MNVLSSFRLCVVMLATTAVIVAAVSAESAARESTIYRFPDQAGGFGPQGLVADSAGNLFGTTYQGGPNNNCYDGCGTAFELSPPSSPGGKWTKSTIHSFNGDGVDGYQPTPEIQVDSHDDVFGTTYFGGTYNGGTIYELSPPARPGGRWTETILFSYVYGGLNPQIGGALLPVTGGGFYATTIQGGSAGGGALLRMTPNGNSLNLTLLHSFDLQRNSRPPGPSLVLDRRGDIYGIRFGMFGVCTPDFPTYCGTVYRFKPTMSKYDVLHRFEGASDGWFPNNELTFDKHGDLFGTTQSGGGGTQGIVFELVPNSVGKPWAEQIVLSLGFAGDYQPLAGVAIDGRGDLFGTTSGDFLNAGVVYRLAPPPTLGGAWTETVLYRFSGGADGDRPDDRLIFGHDGALYGTAYAGGEGTCNSYGLGCGVVFRITP